MLTGRREGCGRRVGRLGWLGGLRRQEQVSLDRLLLRGLRGVSQLARVCLARLEAWCWKEKFLAIGVTGATTF